MQKYFRSLVLIIAAGAVSHAQADIIISLFRTGDALKSPTFTVLPGEVFSVDAEITSTTALPGDSLNSYFAEFSSTPLDASTALFTDQLAVPPYRNAAAGYVFGDDEVLGDAITPTPFSVVFDGTLPIVTTSAITATPLLLARMELMADPLATPSDSVVIDLDTSLFAATAFLDGAASLIDIDSVSPATVTIAAVPEPSTFVIAGLLACGAGIRRRHRRRSIHAPANNSPDRFA